MSNNSDIPVIRYDQKQGDTYPNAWWTAPDATIAQAVWAKFKRVRDDQGSRRADFLRFARLYANKDFEQFIGGLDSGFLGRRLTFNVSRGCVDSACAKISKSKTRPLILTNKGNASEQKRAKKLTQYLDGMFDQTKFYRHARRMFRDGGIFGTGLLKVFRENQEIKVERVFIDELCVDDFDGRNLAPREMHQIKPIAREVLLNLYPDKKDQEAINKAGGHFEFQKNPMAASSNLIAVLESWHLPSGPTDEKSKTDGRHVISLEGHVLLDEPWKKPHFPFIQFHWNEPVVGWYGEGIVEQLVGIQLEINTTLLRIKESQEVVAIPRVLVAEGSNVNSSHITDEIGGIIRYRGTKPDFTTPIGLTREAYDFLEYLYRKAFEECGVSQLSATSKKPAGLDSRVALREYQDIETERFVLVAERFQDVAIEAAKMMIELQREIAEEAKEEGKNVEPIKVKGKGFIETINWSEVDMADDSFVMATYPTNFLPRTPEGQLEHIQELIQAGFVDPQEGMSLLNFPDLQGLFNLRTAARDDVLLLIEQMVEEGEYTPPEPYMDLNLAIRMCQSAYLRGKTDGTPQDRLELLIRFIDACQEIIVKASEPPANPLTNEAAMQNAGTGAPPMNMPPPPQGAPGAPMPGAIAKALPAPRSDLLVPTQAR